MNVGCGPVEERILLTGLHEVADIYCECCKTTLGWKYVSFQRIHSLAILLFLGTRFWVNAKVQREKICYWSHSHDQRQQLGLGRTTTQQFHPLKSSQNVHMYSFRSSYCIYWRRFRAFMVSPIACIVFSVRQTCLSPQNNNKPVGWGPQDQIRFEP